MWKAGGVQTQVLSHLLQEKVAREKAGKKIKKKSKKNQKKSKKKSKKKTRWHIYNQKDLGDVGGLEGQSRSVLFFLGCKIRPSFIP